MTARLFSMPEACRLSGASARQADYWARTGALSPTVPARGSGTYRRYTANDVWAMRVAVVLSALGAQRDVLAAVTEWVVHHPRAQGLLSIPAAGEVQRVSNRADISTGWMIDLTAERERMHDLGIDRLEAVG